MAQFSYDQYEQQQAAKKANATNIKEGSKTQFINSFLKQDGDICVVRFPYHSMADIQYETTHSVKFPGDKWPKRVRCEGDNCPLCKEGIKLDTRFFVKAIVYQVSDNGEVELIPAVWDRAAAFADIDIKNLIQEYGDISEQLFKIKKNGSGLDTRYTISVILNKTVYNPEVYKADFSILDNVDPIRIMTKTIDQYLAAMNPESVAEKPAAVKSEPVVEETKSSYNEERRASYVEQPVEQKRTVRYQF